jgi:hypothetical protein
MAEDCCKLVGNLQLNLPGCIISVNVNSRAEIIRECGGEVLVGPSTGTVSVTGYVHEDAQIHNGCPGRASVTIPWVRRYDCDTNVVYLISAGQGSSSIAGDVEGLATLVTPTGRSFPAINASAASGPATVYMETEQEDGYGLVYEGGPIPFDTRDDLQYPNFGVGEGLMHLQSFSVEFNPGEIPTANYSYMFTMTD